MYVAFASCCIRRFRLAGTAVYICAVCSVQQVRWLQFRVVAATYGGNDCKFGVLCDVIITKVNARLLAIITECKLGVVAIVACAMII